ncbi:MAG: energy transducer TonB [Flavihumibacter sp.]|nr:energy transducer TonB [Flavihumibacter sp.]
MKAILFLLLLGGVSVTAQQTDTIKRYLDEQLNFTTKNKAVYSGFSVKKNNQWQLSAYYPTGNLLLQINYNDKELTVREGAFTVYHNNLQKAQEGTFVYNQLHGTGMAWYPNGILKDSGQYDYNDKTGYWIYRYDNGKTLATGYYKKDAPDSIWYWYRPSGVLSTQELYSNNQVTDLKCYNENGEYTGVTCSISKNASLIHPFFTMSQYIVYKVQQQKESKKIASEGTTRISFTITTEGKVENLIFIESTDPVLDKLIKKIIEEDFPLSPAIRHNQAVATTMELAIPFFW